MSDKVLVERHDAVTVLTLNRPEVHNCVDGETAEAIGETIETFAADDGARVLVVTGAGPLSFCSGADLQNAGTLLEHRYTERASPMGFASLDPGKPTIGAINGYCFAGGLELAAWCDFRIAAANAELGVLNRRWGVPLVDGGTQRLPRIVGQGNALYLVEAGVRINAQRAFQMGFVQEIVPAGEALNRALALAERIAGYPQASIRADRAAVLAAFGLPLGDGLRFEAEHGRATLTDPEMAAGLARFVSGDRPEPPRPAGA
ncbi:MAG: enoyl-CoA hydratase-related protein [Actinomycetota bacterium]